MQDRAWTLRTVGDDRSHENLSNDEAIRAIRRAMHGLDPFEDDRASHEKQRSQRADSRLAA